MEKTKNREWVKNAAIIFLAVLLVLTFFSNTIMNRSLPEVATQSVTGGSIVARVRGTGTVTANGAQQVKAEGTRQIQSVLVKVGQKVETGDVLFTLGQGASEEIEAAEKNLRTLQASYDRTAANGPIASYAGDAARLQQAKKKMDDAKKAMDIAKQAAESVSSLQEQIGDVERKLENKRYELEEKKRIVAEKDEALKEAEGRNTQRLEELQARLDELLSQLPETSETAGELQAKVDAKALEVAEAKEEYDSLVLLYGDLTALTAERDRIAADLKDTLDEDNRNELNTQLGDVLDQINQVSAAETRLKLLSQELAGLESELAQATSTEYDSEIQQLREEIAALQSSDVDAARKALEAAEEDEKAVELEVEELENKLGRLENALATDGSPQSEEYKYRKQAYEDAYVEYMTIYESLAYQVASINQQQTVQNVELKNISEDIEAAKKKLADLMGGEDSQITAKVAGTILTVDATAGDTKQKGDILCSIEVPDMGYSLSFSVTNDQANRLRIGDTATVSNFYWGSEITATLSSIKIDQKNPQTNKLLTFDLTGNVTAGSELTISVGQKSANYDIIVPSSAIRSDSNGSFVLRVDAKNSPLGNRYIARRVPVEVLASDDNNSAVSADLGNGDYVITTSSAPVKNGEQVRLSTS